MRRLLLVAIVLLYALSIPWYRSPGAAPSLWLGLPDWVAAALLCYVAAACCNAAAWLLTEIPEEAEDGGTGEHDAGETREREASS